ncbi:MAG: tRNA (adenosine(37)-N6)-dimethylallyltransferase MiaA [Rikenellaceae bacterium]|jgi:tRNA dimethylallyltransferase|nr:tRNA (adenosine(37)-N6)-dimethylallyltransferase MiaA [Rikenellaceae bacterium]
MTTKTLVVVCGPTGSGKTDLGVALAQQLDTVVLSADSRQLYRGMAIGTAQPDAAQLAAVPHYMVANHEVTEHFTAGDYEREALEVLEQLFAEHDVVVAVGGSGLYIDALCHGLDALPDPDPTLRAELETKWRSGAADELLARLQQLDPAYYAQVDRANPNRVIRALEVCLTSGVPYSTLRSGERKQRDFKVLKIGVTWPREELYDRINCRVDLMMAAGLNAEARALYTQRNLNALQTVGYRELFEYFDGTITLDRAVELIKQNSRRYAKRQMTWFSKDKDVLWFHPQQDIDAIRALVTEFLNK